MHCRVDDNGRHFATFSDMFILNWSQHHYKCYQNSGYKAQTPILSINIIIMTIQAAFSCRSWQAADCSQNNSVPVDWNVTMVTLNYVDLNPTWSSFRTLQPDRLNSLGAGVVKLPV